MGTILSLSRSNKHEFSKAQCDSLVLIEGEGVSGDVHCGKSVKHRSRVKLDPTQPNLRQVHLIHNELILELRSKGFDVTPGKLGENITTSGIDLLGLPKGTVLRVGDKVEIEVTGLRNPCSQLDNYQKGLTEACLDRDSGGALIRKSGIMDIVLKGGVINCGNLIEIKYPPKPYRALERV